MSFEKDSNSCATPGIRLAWIDSYSRHAPWGGKKKHSCSTKTQSSLDTEKFGRTPSGLQRRERRYGVSSMQGMDSSRRQKQRQVSEDSHSHVSRQGTWKVHTLIDYMHCLVPDLLQITGNPCYWGVMDRYEAEALLEGKPEGTFFAQGLCAEGLPLLR
ncbi:hypothetical protein ACRRTK_010164 [Alexandromys fortis]